jgi:hypothetical protein
MIRKCTDEDISDEELEKAIKMHSVLLSNIDLKDI